MRQWVVLWHVCSALVCAIGFFTQKLHYAPTTEINCYEYLRLNTPRISRVYDQGWPQRIGFTEKIITSSTFPTYLSKKDILTRRIDLPRTDDIVKEHAKLVQDINSLKQVVFISPLGEDSRDYDDSVFNEIIETSTTIKPMFKKIQKTGSIPIILLGGASQRHVVKSQVIDFPKPIINLVGTTASPVKHPYPFVMQTSSRQPLKVCMSSLPMMYSTTTKRPSLWERLLNSIIPSDVEHHEVMCEFSKGISMVCGVYQCLIMQL